MATPGNTNQAPQPSGGGSQLQVFVERFQALPDRMKYIIIGVFGFFVFMFLLRMGGDDTPPPRPQPAPQQQQSSTSATVRDAIAAGQVADDGSFSGIEADRPALIQRWMQQQQQTLTDLQENMEGRFTEMQTESGEDREELRDLQNEIKQMIRSFEDKVVTLEEANRRDREILGKLAEETRKLQLQSPVQNGSGGAQIRNRGRISQTPLSGGGSSAAPGGQPFLGNVTDQLAANANNNAPAPEPDPRPFIPPLGFVKGTLLNGVDALAGGGQATPALVRLSGQYKTAMNSTVNLNGCFALVQFEGDISTERALGQPSQMTCVFPDQGVVTYSVSGYVVDKKDGIVGVPGVFFEGNASRIAAAMLADFVAGVAEVIESNQNTTTVDSDGTSQSNLTGDELRGEIAGGAAQSIGSMRDYLFERANRVLPFVRLDATRDVHLVFLSGVELRDAGKPWTTLFNGDGR